MMRTVEFRKAVSFASMILLLILMTAAILLLVIQNPRNSRELTNIWKLNDVRKEEATGLLELSRRNYSEGKREWFEDDDEVKIRMALDYANRGLLIPGLSTSLRSELTEMKLRCEKEL